MLPLLINFWHMQYGFSRRFPNQMWRTHKYATDASLLMCKTIVASFGVFCFHHFAGEKCVLPQYIERPGADNLFATGIMRPAHHNSHAVNSNAPQALGFRCVNCKAEFGSRVAMACHRPTSHLHWNSMRRSQERQVHFIYWTCQCVILHCSGTWYPRYAQYIQMCGFMYCLYFLCWK